ncbi:MAG: hypothetical protein WDO24_01010 [Pseudomonadota bacterium]
MSAEYYREQADRILHRAQTIKSAGAQKTLMDVVALYRNLAAKAELESADSTV